MVFFVNAWNLFDLKWADLICSFGLQIEITLQHFAEPFKSFPLTFLPFQAEE